MEARTHTPLSHTHTVKILSSNCSEHQNFPAYFLHMYSPLMFLPDSTPSLLTFDLDRKGRKEDINGGAKRHEGRRTLREETEMTAGGRGLGLTGRGLILTGRVLFGALIMKEVNPCFRRNCG